MSYAANERVQSYTNSAAQKRARADHIRPKTFAAGTGTLAVLTPVSFNTSTNFWVVWANAGGGANAVETITVDATGGNITISITAPGSTIETTANISATASAAAMQAAINVLANILPGDVVVTGGPGNSGGTTPYVLTFGGQYANTPMTVAVTAVSLTGGGSTVAIAHTTAGVATKSTNLIKGFVWPNPVTLAAGGEVIGQVLTEGEVSYLDIVLPANETALNLKTALRTRMREVGITILDLDAVH